MALATTADRIGFIGAGQMAKALAQGWIFSGLLDPKKCYACDPVRETLENFEKLTGATGCDLPQLVSHCDILILAVKPQNILGVLADLSPRVSRKHLIISIVAGVTLKRLSEGLNGDYRIVRVMPNTPCLVRKSATGYTMGPQTLPEDVTIVHQLFEAVGKAFQLSEHLLDAVTGLSGSGPAFVYMMIEALADGGVRVGLSREVALTLAAQTVLGASQMVLETGRHPAILKDAVASPAGTTIAGLHVLEKGGFRGLLIEAVQAATLRSRELGQQG